jgi:hypothetical protein
MDQLLEFLAIELLTWQFWLGVMAGMLLLVFGALLFWLADNARFDREIAAGLHDRWPEPAPAAHRPTASRMPDCSPLHPLPGRAGSDL